MKSISNFFVLSSLAFLSASTLNAAIMPDLKGLTPDSVKALFASDTNIKIVVMSEAVYSDSLLQGTVAWQKPLPDSFAVVDTVKIKVAAPLTVKVPDLLGKNLYEADSLLKSLDLILFPAGEEESEKYPAGTIVSSGPSRDSLIQRKGTVYVKVSVGVPNYTYTTTSTGTKINLYEDPAFKITSVSLASSDSLGFVLSFNIQVTNPYKHSFTAESFNYFFMLDDVRFAKGASKTTIKLSAGATSTGKILIPLTYASIKPSMAKLLLEKGRYKLYGTFSLVVESGFSQKDFDARGEFQPFLNSSPVKTRLEEIAASK